MTLPLTRRRLRLLADLHAGNLYVPWISHLIRRTALEYQNPPHNARRIFRKVIVRIIVCVIMTYRVSLANPLYLICGEAVYIDRRLQKPGLLHRVCFVAIKCVTSMF